MQNTLNNSYFQNIMASCLQGESNETLATPQLKFPVTFSIALLFHSLVLVFLSSPKSCVTILILRLSCT